jgi:membrane protein implicated in regulation of membrane protease activity
MHSLVKSRMVRKQLAHWPPVLRNASVSPLIWIFALVPASLSVVFAGSTGWLISGFLFSALLYSVFYSKLIYFGWKLSKRKRQPQTENNTSSESSTGEALD